MTAEISFALPDAVVQLIAERAAAIVLEQLDERRADGPEFLTVAEAAGLLRCDRQRLYDLASTGRLRRYKDGSRVLFRRAELLAHLGAVEALAERRRAA